MESVLAIYNWFNWRFEGAWNWENSCSPGIWLEGCNRGDALSCASSDCAILLSWAGEHTLSACPSTPPAPQVGLPSDQQITPRLHEIQALPVVRCHLVNTGISCPLNNRVSTNFQEMLGERLGGLYGPLQHLGQDMLLQHRSPEPGPWCRTMQGPAWGRVLHFDVFFTALISSGKRIPEYCMLPVGSCGFFLSCKWQIWSYWFKEDLFSLSQEIGNCKAAFLGPLAEDFFETYLLSFISWLLFHLQLLLAGD